MRLDPEQLVQIRLAAAGTLGDDAAVWLFGSRVDDDVLGGDIDLYVELDATPAEALERELKFYAALQRSLGEQRIDLVVHRHGTPMRPIDLEARRHGTRL
jgi:predicted nucleotidyltransferase